MNWKTFLVAAGCVLFAASSAAATLTVTNAADSGAGSLRAAIISANVIPDHDTIEFAISGPGVQTVHLLSQLPVVTTPITIDGWSQGGPAYQGPPLIELDGSALVPIDISTTGAHGLELRTEGVTVRGLVINRCRQAGIFIEGGGHHIIVGNYIGTDATGLLSGFGNGGDFFVDLFLWDGITALSTSFNQVGVDPGSPNTADRNVLSGNAFAGYFHRGGDGNVIAGNYVGTDVTGTKDLRNVLYGIYIEASSNNDVASNLVAHNNRNILVAFGSENIVRDNVVEDAGNQDMI